MPSPHNHDDAQEFRSSHPLIVKLREIRNRHNKTLVEVEACMGKGDGALKFIEEGRRPLPKLIAPNGTQFSDWLRKWLECVEASDEEQEEIERLLMLLVLGRLRRRLE
jgi:hypothetical protein